MSGSLGSRGGGADPIRSERRRSLRGGGSPSAWRDVAIGCRLREGGRIRMFKSSYVGFPRAVRRRHACQYWSV